MNTLWISYVREHFLYMWYMYIWTFSENISFFSSFHYTIIVFSWTGKISLILHQNTFLNYVVQRVNFHTRQIHKERKQTNQSLHTRQKVCTRLEKVFLRKTIIGGVGPIVTLCTQRIFTTTGVVGLTKDITRDRVALFQFNALGVLTIGNVFHKWNVSHG